MRSDDDVPNIQEDSKTTKEKEQRDLDVRKEVKLLLKKKLKPVHQQIIAPPGE